MPRGKKGKNDEEEPEKQKAVDKKDQKQSKRGKRGGSDSEEEKPQKNVPDRKGAARNNQSDDEAPDNKKGKQISKPTKGNNKDAKGSDDEKESATPAQQSNKNVKKGNEEDKSSKTKGATPQSDEEDQGTQPAQKSNKKKDKKKAGKKQNSDNEEEKPKSKKGQTLAPLANDSDDDVEEVSKPAQKAAKKNEKKVPEKKQESASEGSEGDVASKPAAKNKSKKDKKKAGKGKPAPDKVEESEEDEDEDEDEDEEEEEEEKPAPKPVQKGNGQQSKKKGGKQDSDDKESSKAKNEDSLASQPAKKANKKKDKKKGAAKKQESEDEDEEEEEEKANKNAKPAPVKDEEEEDDDVEEAKPASKGKDNKKEAKAVDKKDTVGKPQNKKGGAVKKDESDDEDEKVDEELTTKLSNLKVAETEDPEAKAKRIAERKQEKDKKKKDKKEKKNVKKAPKKEVDEDEIEAEEEETEYEKYQRVLEMKGRDAPPFVHLRTSAAERNKIGNDIRMENFGLSVPGKVLLKEVNMTLAYGRRYGLVGRNGLGKSTLMARIAERDGIQVANHLRILYVEQEVPGDETTPIEYVLRADKEREWLLEEEKELNRLDKENPDWMDDPKEKRSYSIKDIFDRLREIESEKAIPRAAAILVGLGFPADEIKVKPSSAYSGGWRMRIALARALFSRPEILLLDEPTNHLDLHACVWLERYLSNWTNTLIVISHEATFLNEIVDGIVHIHDKTLTQYKGDYWAFTKARDQNQRAQEKSKDKQDKKVKELKEFINKNKNNSNAKQGSSRRRLLEKMEDVQVDRDDPSLKVSFPDPDKLTPPLLQFKEASFGYDPKKPIFKNLDFSIDMDSRVALVGLNGVGKSTLMKLMYGQLQETEGYIERSRKMRVARFTQHHMDLLDETVSAAAYLGKKFGVGDEHRLRQHLGRFGITGNLAVNKISTLSGGQKSRVVLAELAFAEPHILLLDEPSNHLDLDAIEALAQGLNAFEGGVVLISHNQRLISLVCNQIWVVTRKGHVEVFNGEFAEYKDAIIAEMDFD